jgi:hypothetical protein
MNFHLRRMWSIFVRSLIGLLLAAAGLGVYLALNPAALGQLMGGLPLPGVVKIPAPGPTPPAPLIAAAPGKIPAGPLAFYGIYMGGRISCGFVMEAENGRQVGVTAAHATADLPPGTSMMFQTAEGDVAARLSGPLERGSPFVGEQFTTDYVLWAVTEMVHPGAVLRADERGNGQAGEAVWVYGPGTGASADQRWAGVVMQAGPAATWIQLEDTFNPGGLSGCPVVSAVTGKLIGMAVAGANQPPVVMGLHPAGALIRKITH